MKSLIGNRHGEQRIIVIVLVNGEEWNCVYIICADNNGNNDNHNNNTPAALVHNVYEARLCYKRDSYGMVNKMYIVAMQRYEKYL